MDYTLAKKLKEAGWLEKYPKSWTSWCVDVGKYENLPNPTLSELIQACGENVVLHNVTDCWVAGIGCKYECGESYIDTPLKTYSEGITPTEAVALLWLEINKK